MVIETEHKETEAMTNIPAYVDIAGIKASYAPYNRYPMFEVGYETEMSGKSLLVHGLSAVNQQAFDRGADAALRVKSAARWIENNVGAN